jgi:hypothetical protein
MTGRSVYAATAVAGVVLVLVWLWNVAINIDCGQGPCDTATHKVSAVLFYGLLAVFAVLLALSLWRVVVGRRERSG